MMEYLDNSQTGLLDRNGRLIVFIDVKVDDSLDLAFVSAYVGIGKLLALLATMTTPGRLDRVSACWEYSHAKLHVRRRDCKFQ